MSFDYQARMQALIASVDADVVALVPGANMVYFTGLHFHLSERPTIAFLSKDGLSLIVPELEQAKITQRPDLDARMFTWTDDTGHEGSFQEAVTTLGLTSKVLGVDGMTMRVFEWLALAQCGVELATSKDVSAALLLQRAKKTPEEVDAMRRAIALSEAALQDTLDYAKPGMTEKQITAKLTDALAAHGSQGHAFSPIVLTGPKSALPHGMPGDRVLGEDEFLLIDYGGTMDEYPADITRTFCLGTPSDEMRKIYGAVLQANLAAQAAAKPGIACSAVDKAARDVIEAAGYGEYFIHRTGHGLGLEGHEWPNIASNNDMLLEPGMVFTIEPGIYIPEIGGVRIEDNMLITEDGAESLTSYPRELT
ncbi:aminopeptidase P family protein [Phototrophicus methaneseepsis]|uniref:Aminopeptidase P family protein n=1 Tax=Phototrophicus methaneseepsis TaxID=2710758 RepID=A0A7S8ED13_9CHLR|nr:Xaa-Pro peptidase family protein [Phototrophicus methaneseepsis]QPC84722.1 aminopeptidase P family protein [Phototrophicus methaneseepsis]